MTPELRAAGPADLDAILDIERASFADPWSAGSILPELRPDPRRAPLLALVDGQPVGFALLWVVADEMHIVNLAVAPALRRAGIGRALLTAALDSARERDLARVTLEVRDSNEAARRLYGSAGFREVALRPRYYPDTREDAVIMVLELR